MEWLAGTVAAALGVFAGTNVDDVIVLTVLFLGSRATGAPRPWQIVAGQYLGMAVLVAVSAAAAVGLAVVPDRPVGLLGLVPLGLGVAGLVRAARRPSAGTAVTPVVAGGVMAVAGLTIANGADNVSVYTPAFRTVGVAGSLVMTAVFAALVGVWCAASAWTGARPRVVGAVERTGLWLVPVVFVAVGAVVIARSWP
jgi:cadmium resistance protein CadD (predicted permease)